MIDFTIAARVRLPPPPPDYPFNSRNLPAFERAFFLPGTCPAVFAEINRISSTSNWKYLSKALLVVCMVAVARLNCYGVAPGKRSIWLRDKCHTFFKNRLVFTPPNAKFWMEAIFMGVSRNFPVCRIVSHLGSTSSRFRVGAINPFSII